jgi:predicted Zn-dependent protease
MCARCSSGMSRRWVALSLLAIGAAGCSENAVSGRKQLAFIPDEQLVQIADQAWEQMLSQASVIRDPGLQGQLAQVAEPLVAASGRPELQWEFVVFDQPELNAFVLPNGKVVAFRGMLEFVRDADELGAVIGHEVAHVLARHAAERLSQQLAVQAGISIAQAVFSGENGENADVIAGALGAGATLGVLLPYSRNHELEADRLGVDLMRKVGMDDAAAVRFWERMIAERTAEGRDLEALSTHPADGRRLEQLRRLTA